MNNQNEHAPLAGAAGSERRRITLDGKHTLLTDDRAVSAFLQPLQPRWKARNAKAGRIHLLDWFRNQGQRSRLVVRGGYVIGRIDCLPPNATGSATEGRP